MQNDTLHCCQLQQCIKVLTPHVIANLLVLQHIQFQILEIVILKGNMNANGEKADMVAGLNDKKNNTKYWVCQGTNATITNTILHKNKVLDASWATWTLKNSWRHLSMSLELFATLTTKKIKLIPILNTILAPTTDTAINDLWYKPLCDFFMHHVYFPRTEKIYLA